MWSNLWRSCLGTEAGITVKAKYSTTRFADNTVITVNNRRCAAYIINKTNIYSNRYGLKINSKKTKAIMISKKNTIITEKIGKCL